MISWSNVQAIAPGDAGIQAFADPGGTMVSMAYLLLNSADGTPGAGWAQQPNGPALLDTAATYLAAHMFTIGNKSEGAGGPVSSERVGDVARARDILQENAWDSTPYGKMLRILMRTLPGRMGFASGSSAVPPFYVPFFP